MKLFKFIDSQEYYFVIAAVVMLVKGLIIAAAIILAAYSLTRDNGSLNQVNAGNTTVVAETQNTALEPGDDSTATATGENTQQTITPVSDATATMLIEVTPVETQPSPTFIPVTPTMTAVPAVYCPEQPGRVEDILYTPRLVANPVPAKIYLPPCYDDGLQRYPVLYLLHQEGGDQEQWLAYDLIAKIEQSINNGNLDPLIIVMPQAPERLFNATDGGPGSYESEFRDGLVFYIDETYRTQPTPENRAIAGVSRGGIWAIEISFMNPDLFNTSFALSPSLDTNFPRAQFDPATIVRAASTLPQNIYLLISQSDSALPQTQALSTTLNNMGFIHTFEVDQGEYVDRIWNSAVDDLVAYVSMLW